MWNTKCTIVEMCNCIPIYCVVDEAELILKCVEGGEVIHCRGLASPQGLIDLIDQKEDQEEEEEEEEEEHTSYLSRAPRALPV